MFGTGTLIGRILRFPQDLIPGETEVRMIRGPLPGKNWVAGPAKLEYRPAIDGLRAVAVLAVLLFHLDRTLLPGGFVGVDIFFVISGYLITSVILSDCERNRFSFGRFYQRRIARLLPAFVAMGTVTLVGAALLYSSQDLASAASNLSASAASVVNLKLMIQGNYFVLSPDAQPFLHCWSLSVEEQFYLLFPACFVVLYKTARPYLTRILMVLWVVSLLSCIVLTYKKPEWAFYLLPPRAWELLTGSLLAASSNNKKAQVQKHIGSALSYCGLLLVVSSVVFISESSAFPGYFAALPVVGTAFLLMAIETSHPFVDRVLSRGPMVAIGRASYSLYLWHWPIFSLIDYRLFLSSSAVRIGSKVLLTMAATTISYLFVERPSRVFLNDPARRWLAFAAFGCSLATLVPLGIGIRRANYVDATARDVARGGLHFNQSAKGGSMVLMGDSNAAMYGKMIVELAKEQSLKLDVIGVAAGDPLPHSSGAPSPLWLDSLNVVRREKPNFLLVVCNWTKLEGDKARLRVALDQLAPLVGQIILFTQPPELPSSAAREGIRTGARPPFMEDPDERAHRLENNEVVRSAKGEKISVVDVEPMFSKKSGEVMFFDEHGNQLYQDRDHLSDAGAQIVKQRLVQIMKNEAR